MRRILEVCCGDTESVMAAKDGGADRVELCCALGEGGLTPSYGQVQMAMTAGIPVNVLIRPRRGDFNYSPADVRTMTGDIVMANTLGVNGVVVGALTPDGDIDVETVQALIEEADGMQLTFHRAFDLCRDSQEALETLIELGFDNVLTSGLRPNALEGVGNLARLVEQARGRINIMAGCGVTPGNVAEIIRISGISSIHSTCSGMVESGMRYRRQDVNMGNEEDEYRRKTTDEECVRRLREIIDSI